jgi:N6-adenosine-specific RNA methylase IME4
MTVRTVQEDVQLAKNLTPTAKEAIRSSDIPKKDAIKLARLEAGKQGEVVALMADRKIDVDRAVLEMQRREKIEVVKEKFGGSNGNEVDILSINKKYVIIYADPPWKYFESGAKSQQLHYPTMTIDEIKNIPVQKITADNAVLFLWVTSPILRESFDVIGAWGFKYRTIGFTWVKRNPVSGTPFFGLGAWTRANAELCLIAAKGQISRINNSVSQVVESPIEEHSKKPQVVRDLITKLMGELPRIELFARDTATGWDSWGNE